MARKLSWAPNIWMGTSIENQDYVSRAHLLAKVPATVRFLSIEPLLGPVVGLPLDKIRWVIVGGESGPGARPMEEGWVIPIKEACEKANVPFFFKQWGGVQKSRTGRALQGREWNDMPPMTASINGTRSVA